MARSCAGLLADRVDPVWLGHSFEATIINEVKAYNHYLQLRRPLHYYRYNGGYEVDLLIETRKKNLQQKARYTAIEIKSSKNWDNRWSKPMLDLKKKSLGELTQLIGVYWDDKSYTTSEGIQIYSAEDFLLKLAKGDIFKAAN